MRPRLVDLEPQVRLQPKELWRKDPAERQAEARPDDLHHERRARRGPRGNGGNRTVRPTHVERKADDDCKADQQPQREEDSRRFGITCHESLFAWRNMGCPTASRPMRVTVP